MASGAAPPDPAAPAFQPAALSGVWQGFTAPLQLVYPDFKATFVAVSAEDLRDRFTAIGNGVEQPDLLLSTWMLSGPQFDFLRDLAVASLGKWSEARQGEPAGLHPGGASYDWMLLASAGHPEEARAFVVWMEDGMLAQAERYAADGIAKGPVSLAIDAVQSASSGGEIRASDPELAKVPPGVLQRAAFTPPDRQALSGLALRVDVLHWEANERFAVYGMRVIAHSPQAFGVVHPLVVLRRGDDGRWGVLQVSANLGPGLRLESLGELLSLAQKVRPELVKAVAGVTLAAPQDGDTRVGVPELWWDNPGGARLLAVEWQVSPGDTHLFLVPDTGARLQVRVTAAFARRSGSYLPLGGMGVGRNDKAEPVAAGDGSSVGGRGIPGTAMLKRYE